MGARQLLIRICKDPASWVNLLGLVAACAAVLVLVQPPPPPPGAPLLATVPLRPGTAGPGTAQDLQLLLPQPPRLAQSVLRDSTELQYTVLLPPATRAQDIHYRQRPLSDHPQGALLRLEPSDLVWGVNPVPLTGTDRYGTPIDRAWTLVIADTQDPDSFTVGAIRVRLDAQGFHDTDDLIDDFSTIAREYVEQALEEIPDIDIGPAVASNLRVGITRVEFLPRQGYIEGHLYLDLAHIDLDVESVLSITYLPIHRLWLDLELVLGVDPAGRPRIQVREVQPHIDLVRSGEGWVAWVLDHGAWFLEIAGELLSEEPIREALTRGIDESLGRWVDRFRFQTVPPLQPVTLTAEYRFSELSVDEGGLTALIDVRLSCDRYAISSIGQLIRGLPRRFDELEELEPELAVVQIGLDSDAVNAALNGLWRCGALDTQVSFDEAQARLPIAVPRTVRTRFPLPPVLQTGRQGEMAIGVPQVQVELDYPDSRYQVSANAVLPIYLHRSQDGRQLQVGFDPSVERTILYTDCVTVDGESCQDNALFDRLAWLAIDQLPPIGASIPLPDVRLRANSSEAISLRIHRIHWYPSSGLVQVDGAYGLARSGD